jgi:hypothetical protein
MVRVRDGAELGTTVRPTSYAFKMRRRLTGGNPAGTRGAATTPFLIIFGSAA